MVKRREARGTFDILISVQFFPFGYRVPQGLIHVAPRHSPSQQGASMSVILGCLFTQHDLRLVAAAIAVCLFACIVGRAMTLRARASQQRRSRLIWLLCAGMVTGMGVWEAHFVS